MQKYKIKLVLLQAYYVYNNKVNLFFHQYLFTPNEILITLQSK